MEVLIFVFYMMSDPRTAPRSSPAAQSDHGHGPWYAPGMDTLPVSKFKATCLAAIERVRATGRPLLVTRRGVPIAQVIPPPPQVRQSGYGAMRGTAEELGDIVEPLGDEDWEAAR